MKDNYSMDTVASQIRFEEGIRLKKYQCTAGKDTIGIGHNLTAHPTFNGEKIPNKITKEFAELLFDNDLKYTYEILKIRFPLVETLAPAHRDAVLNMAFQLGVDGLLGFKRMIDAIVAGKFDEAAKHALDSKWAKLDTPHRAKRVAWQLKTGFYYTIPT